MARRRKPVELRLLEGTYRADRHGPIPEAGGSPPIKPRDLAGDAGSIWKRLVAYLAPVLRESDGPMLAELCWWWAELRRAQAVIAETKPGASAYLKKLSAVSACSEKVNRLASQFGLTPTDRAKLRFEAAVHTPPKVASRPRTKLDQAGGPG